MFKKLISLLLLVTLCILLIGLLTGCGSSGPASDLLEEDIAEEFEARTGIDVEVEGMDITYSNCRDGLYEAEIEVDFSKVIQRELCTANVKYKYYNNGGWKLVDIDLEY